MLTDVQTLIILYLECEVALRNKPDISITSLLNYLLNQSKHNYLVSEDTIDPVPDLISGVLVTAVTTSVMEADVQRLRHL